MRGREKGWKKRSKDRGGTARGRATQPKGGEGRSGVESSVSGLT
jgi:hypothetical protein